MLLDLIQKAVAMGADSLEIEYKDGRQQVCVMRGAMGVGIASVKSNSPKSTRLLAEIDALRKARRVQVGGVAYRAAVTEYDSFGEMAYRIALAKGRRR